MCLPPGNQSWKNLMLLLLLKNQHLICFLTLVFAASPEIISVLAFSDANLAHDNYSKNQVSHFKVGQLPPLAFLSQNNAMNSTMQAIPSHFKHSLALSFLC